MATALAQLEVVETKAQPESTVRHMVCARCYRAVGFTVPSEVAGMLAVGFCGATFTLVGRIGTPGQDLCVVCEELSSKHVASCNS